MSSLPKLDHLRISFDDIKSATNNFDKQNLLGQGGFGRVYKGQLPSSSGSSDPDVDTSVAVKRLDVKGGQGEQEFLMEIVMLACYKHENLVSLIGFSDEGDEKILVYKHEVNGSLDKHVASPNLKWEQRLRICLGAARGLGYLGETSSLVEKFLPHLVKLHKEKGTLHTIINPSLVEQAKPYSLQVFYNIAFQCLNEDRTQRLPMVLVVKGLETTLKHQLVTYFTN